MKLTKEQLDIIQSKGNIKINAVAGSGKTTTIIEYAKARPKSARLLYIAFNRSVRLEAKRKFADLGLSNVRVETAHSLAYKNIVFKHRYKVRANDYKTTEIVEILNLKGDGEKHAEYVVANHINKFVSYYCNSDKQEVSDLNYLDTVSDKQAQAFVKKFYEYIEKQTKLLLNKMDSGKVDVTHDFYLKKFQLSNPKLNYDYILFDEGQDASMAMLDVFFKQKATKVIVGDTHQQIYAWRYAVNSLEKADYNTYNLSTSFRFSQEVADLAMEVLKWKRYINGETNVRIIGRGNSNKAKLRAVLGRTNLGLLLKAIEYVTEMKSLTKIYFEGNINSYTYAEDGASLYDVLHLYNDRRHLIRDSLIRKMRDLDELEDYVKKTEDVELGLMIDIVKEYGSKIPNIIKQIKDKHIDNDDKENAQIIFSTVHRSKGMEYDTVQIIDDFISEDRLKTMKEDRGGGINIERINEEINLLYVAITRARNSVYLPGSLRPKDFPNSDKVRFIGTSDVKEMEKPVKQPLIKSVSTVSAVASVAKKQEVRSGEKKSAEKAYSVKEVRKTHSNAYAAWTKDMDLELIQMYCEGINVRDLSKHFGRTRGAIRSRIKKLELKELCG